MYDILTLNKIAAAGLQTFHDQYNITDDCKDPDGIILRSFSMHDMELSENLKAVARAGAGINNIPVDKCSEKGIVVFNTPGANANAVKELVIAALLISSRDVVGGINWAASLKGQGAQVAKAVEKGKSAFAGPEIQGKTLGVIGLGAIGVMVANAAHSLGMEVLGYDPYISVDAAWGLSRSVIHVNNLNELLGKCDYITMHVPLLDDTREMINAEKIALMKDHVRILNFSRNELVNNQDLLKALADGKVAKYITDFPSDDLLGIDNIICVPHLGASTPESEENCAVMASLELKDYLENGNIVNSVNFPNCSMPRETVARVCVMHKNIPNMLSQISNAVAQEKINIETMINKSKGDYAYTMLEICDKSEKVCDVIEKIDGVIRVRIIF